MSSPPVTPPTHMDVDETHTSTPSSPCLSGRPPTVYGQPPSVPPQRGQSVFGLTVDAQAWSLVLAIRCCLIQLFPEDTSLKTVDRQSVTSWPLPDFWSKPKINISELYTIKCLTNMGYRVFTISFPGTGKNDVPFCDVIAYDPTTNKWCIFEVKQNREPPSSNLDRLGTHDTPIALCSYLSKLKHFTTMLSSLTGIDVEHRLVLFEPNRQIGTRVSSRKIKTWYASVISCQIFPLGNLHLERVAGTTTRVDVNTL